MLIEYDPHSYAIDADPYPVYRRLRDEAPVYHNKRLDFWALCRYPKHAWPEDPWNAPAERRPQRRRRT